MGALPNHNRRHDTLFLQIYFGNCIRRFRLGPLISNEKIFIIWLYINLGRPMPYLKFVDFPCS